MEVNFISILESIFKISLIASVLASIVLILRPIIKKAFGINILYLLWLLVIIKLIVPYGPESKASIYNIFNTVKTSNSYEEKVIKSNSKIKLSTEIINDSFKNSSETQSSIINSPKQSNNNINQYNNIKNTFLIIWILGILIFVCISIISYYNLFKIIKNRLYKYDKHSFNILEDCLELLNIKKNIKILVVKNINAPALSGFINPKILIPKNIIDDLSNEEIRYIILHELCHYKRKDLQLNFIIHLLKIIYWFNPIIYFALDTMKEDLEIACDDMVISKLNKKETLHYGYTIINVLRYVKNNKNILGTTSMISNKKRLKERIKMISENKKFNIRKIIIGLILVLVLGFVTLSSKVNNAKESVGFNIKNSQENYNSNNMKEENILDKNYINEEKSKVVIYNSHVNEEYKDGYSIIDASMELDNKLKNLNINSTFLRCEKPSEYENSFENSENIIKNNIKDYSNSVLIDIHRLDAFEENSDLEDIVIDLSKNSINYEENLRFAENFSKEIESRGIKARIVIYDEGINNFNLHLSKKSLFINIGDENMTNIKVNELMDVVSEAIMAII